jgi:hypothetical protein
MACRECASLPILGTASANSKIMNIFENENALLYGKLDSSGIGNKIAAALEIGLLVQTFISFIHLNIGLINERQLQNRYLLPSWALYDLYYRCMHSNYYTIDICIHITIVVSRLLD